MGARYQGGPGRVADASRIAVDVSDTPLPVTTHVTLELSDRLEEGGVVESPSHRLKVRGRKVELAKNARLDRDVVVRWPVMAPEVGLSIQETHRPEGHASAGRHSGSARAAEDDTPSGAGTAVGHERLYARAAARSMPARVASALIESLGEGDTLEMVEFSEPAAALPTGCGRPNQRFRAAGCVAVGRRASGRWRH